MAEPITGLTATWLKNQGIQLNWTAATDVTSSSVYEVYILINADQYVPTWSLSTTLKANIVRSFTQIEYSLSNPTTSYLFPFPSNIGNSYTFRVVHIDYLKVESTAATISVFQDPVMSKNGPIHFANMTGIDPYGQFFVNFQDSYEEIAESVSMVLGTTVGERSIVPTFGIEDLPLTEISAYDIQSAITKWEPRAQADVSIKYDNENNASVSVKLANN